MFSYLMDSGLELG